MSDLRILEAVIALLLALYIVRPFVRKFRRVDGLSALPLISFLLIVAVLPSFGFRPELAPLALFSFIAFLTSLPRLADIARRLRTDDYDDRRPATAFSFILILCLSFVFAFAFTPRERDGTQREKTAAVFAADDERRGVELVLTVETGLPGSAEGPRPVLIFGPSVLGSAGIFDDYREALVSRGFTVVTYVRPGIDVPAVDAVGRLRLPGIAALTDSFAALLFGDDYAFAAEAGARLEKARLDDLRFTVDYVRSRMLAGDERFTDIDPTRISVAGYGAGGAAAAMYAAEADPETIRSVVAVESPVHAYLSAESEAAAQSSAEGGLDDGLYPRMRRWFGKAKTALSVRKVRGGIRGDEASMRPRVPVLFLTADWIRQIPLRDERYGTQVRLFRLSGKDCAIVSAAGAGPLDYTDIPLDYPVYSFFARGKDRFIPHGTSFASQAAELTARFAEDFFSSGTGLPGVRIEKK